MKNVDKYRIASGRDMSLPTTYTPTTHSVSRAKKSKRVHVCNHPECPKVFTRAEHRRRHEMRHDSKKPYPCTSPGCKRVFHRSDYLSRHQKKHESRLGVTSRTPFTKLYSSKDHHSSQLRSTESPINPIIQADEGPLSYHNTWTSMDASLPPPVMWLKQNQSSTTESVESVPLYSLPPDLSASLIPKTTLPTPASPSFLCMSNSQILDPFFQSPASNVGSGVDSSSPWDQTRQHMHPFEYGPVTTQYISYILPAYQYTSKFSSNTVAPFDRISGFPICPN